MHFTTDLMLGSQVSQAARGRGLSVEMINRLDRLFERMDETTSLVVVDLQCAQWSAEQFGKLWAARSTTAPVVAYAQHVFPELIVEARQVGIDNVMTRGQFTSSVSKLLDSLAASDV